MEKKRSVIEQAHARKPKDKESNMEDPSELQDRIPSRRSASWKKLSGELSSSKGETNTCDERVSESETESENAPSTSTGSSHDPYFKMHLKQNQLNLKTTTTKNKTLDANWKIAKQHIL